MAVTLPSEEVSVEMIPAGVLLGVGRQREDSARPDKSWKIRSRV